MKRTIPPSKKEENGDACFPVFGIKLCNRPVCAERVSKTYSICFLINKCSYSVHIELYWCSFIYMYLYLVKYSTCSLSSVVWPCIICFTCFSFFFFLSQMVLSVSCSFSLANLLSLASTLNTNKAVFTKEPSWIGHRRTASCCFIFMLILVTCSLGHAVIQWGERIYGTILFISN